MVILVKYLFHFLHVYVDLCLKCFRSPNRIWHPLLPDLSDLRVWLCAFGTFLNFPKPTIQSEKSVFSLYFCHFLYVKMSAHYDRLPGEMSLMECVIIHIFKRRHCCMSWPSLDPVVKCCRPEKPETPPVYINTYFFLSVGITDSWVLFSWIPILLVKTELFL